jgi:hypothetical protein
MWEREITYILHFYSTRLEETQLVVLPENQLIMKKKADSAKRQKYYIII